MIDNFFKIEIEGNQFQKSYLVYIITIKHGNDVPFYYVGQTGDNFHLTARPAFRRLSAHLDDQGSSTQNQIYRSIITKILEPKVAIEKGVFKSEVKDQVSRFLTESKITMFVYPILKFDSEIDETSHKKNRQEVQKIEKDLISYIIEKFGEEKILNLKIPKNQKDFNTKESEDIFKHFMQE